MQSFTNLSEDARKASGFVRILVIVTVTPMLLFALAGRVEHEGNATLQAVAMQLAIVGLAHVGTTGFLVFDRRYRDFMRQRLRLFLVYPAIVILIGVMTAILGGLPGARLFLMTFITWQLYHFTRQNWGILCLIARATKTDRPSEFEKWMCYLAAAGAVLKSLTSVDGGLNIGGLSAVGWVLCLGGVFGGLGVGIRLLQSGAPSLRVASSLSVAIFFLPIFLLDPRWGSLSVGAAHGLQYMAFMTVLAADRRQGAVLPRLLVVIATAAVFTLVYGRFGDASLWGSFPMLAEVTPHLIVVWHFMVDAEVWQLRKPFPRQVVGESFGFLFR